MCQIAILKSPTRLNHDFVNNSGHFISLFISAPTPINPILIKVKI